MTHSKAAVIQAINDGRLDFARQAVEAWLVTRSRRVVRGVLASPRDARIGAVWDAIVEMVCGWSGQKVEKYSGLVELFLASGVPVNTASNQHNRALWSIVVASGRIDLVTEAARACAKAGETLDDSLRNSLSPRAVMPLLVEEARADLLLHIEGVFMASGIHASQFRVAGIVAASRNGRWDLVEQWQGVMQGAGRTALWYRDQVMQAGPNARLIKTVLGFGPVELSSWMAAFRGHCHHDNAAASAAIQALLAVRDNAAAGLWMAANTGALHVANLVHETAKLSHLEIPNHLNPVDEACRNGHLTLARLLVKRGFPPALDHSHICLDSAA
jgi:hypothetical protein